MTEIDAALAKLVEPFPPELIGKLPRVTCGDCSDRRKTCQQHKKERCGTCNAWVSTKHIHLDYVGHADVTRRLLDTDPMWSWEPAATDGNGLPLLDTDDKDNPVGLWIKLTVCGVTRLGYGSCPSGQNDAVKVLIGDALRNAAMRFGVALDLWAKGDRADPAAENAVAAGGTAARRRPSQQRTDHAWLDNVEARIKVARSRAELAKLADEIRAKKAAGQCEQTHEDHLWEVGKRRQEIVDSGVIDGMPVNKDGSVSRSRMTDEERTAAGIPTKAEARADNRAAREIQAMDDTGKRADRSTSVDQNDPWAAGGPLPEFPEMAGDRDE
jgi:hypothetical protein